MVMDPWCLLCPIPSWGGRVRGSAAAPRHNLPRGARRRRRAKRGGRREFALSDAGNLWGSPQGAPGREKSASFLTKAEKFSRCPLGFTALSEIDLCSAPPEKITGLYFRLPHTQMGRSSPHLPVTAGSSTARGAALPRVLLSPFARAPQGAGGAQAGRDHPWARYQQDPLVWRHFRLCKSSFLLCV